MILARILSFTKKARSCFTDMTKSWINLSSFLNHTQVILPGNHHPLLIERKFALMQVLHIGISVTPGASSKLLSKCSTWTCLEPSWRLTYPEPIRGGVYATPKTHAAFVIGVTPPSLASRCVWPDGWLHMIVEGYLGANSLYRMCQRSVFTTPSLPLLWQRNWSGWFDSYFCWEGKEQGDARLFFSDAVDGMLSWSDALRPLNARR